MGGLYTRIYKSTIHEDNDEIFLAQILITVLSSDVSSLILGQHVLDRFSEKDDWM